MTPREEFIFQLEQAQRNAAPAFAVVCVDNETHSVVHATGPFAEAEQALVQAGVDAKAWQEFIGDEACEFDYSYLVVPLWEPST